MVKFCACLDFKLRIGASVGIFEVIIIYDICVQKFMIFKNGALNVA